MDNGRLTGLASGKKSSKQSSLQCRRFGACDRKFAVILEFAAILVWEKWVGRGWGKMEFFLSLPLPLYFSFHSNSHSLGRIFVSPQASSEFESKMALD